MPRDAIDRSIDAIESNAIESNASVDAC